MEIKRLETKSLSSALLQMEVGETRVQPEGYAPATVAKECSALNSKYGCRFATRENDKGERVITRFK